MLGKSFMHLLAGWPPAGAAGSGIRHPIKQTGRIGRWHAGTGIVASQVNGSGDRIDATSHVVRCTPRCWKPGLFSLGRRQPWQRRHADSKPPLRPDRDS
jgi:hypothetical protein